MRTATLVLASLCLLGVASAFYRHVQHTPVDKETLVKQKRIYQLLWHVSQPLLHPELKELADSLQLEKSERHFKNPEVVKTFLKYYRHGYFQTREQRFSAYTESGRLQLESLVSLMFNAKDFDIFYKVAAWAREYLNPDLCVTAIYITVILRHDAKGIILPAPYEIQPWRYFNTGVITDAWRAALLGKTYNKKHPYVVPVNYNCSYTSAANNVMAYYTEDVSLLAMRDLSRFQYPYWAKLEEYHQPNYTRRGDYFYYVSKIIVARYYLERLSNHLPDIEPIDYEEPICGIEAYSQLVENIRAADRRLRDAADKGYIYDDNWTKYSLHEPGGSEIFARLVEGNADSANIQYYRRFYYDLLAYAQQYINCCNEYTVGQCGLYRPDSVLSSPVFYRIVKRIVLVMDYFKDTLPPYSHKELWMPGVKVESLNFDKLVTFYETFDVDLNNAVPVASVEVAHKLAVVAQTRRLNHKPFSYHVHVTSDRDTEAVVRVWIGPRRDRYGRELSLNEIRRYMFFLDGFVCKLYVPPKRVRSPNLQGLPKHAFRQTQIPNFTVQKGKNELERNSKEFVGNRVPVDFLTLIHTTEEALSHKSHPFLDAFFQDVSYNSHLKLPRGYPSGMGVTTFAMVTPIKPHEPSWIYPSPDYASYFPFDRRIDDHGFWVPNAYFGEAKVYHWEDNEKTAD